MGEVFDPALYAGVIGDQERESVRNVGAKFCGEGGFYFAAL